MVGDNPHELCDRETLSLPVIPPADPNFCAWDKVALGEDDPALTEGASDAASDLKRNSAGEFDLPKPPEGRKGTKQERLMKSWLPCQVWRRRWLSYSRRRAWC